MASVFPFNNIKIGGVQVVGPEDFIYGSGNLTLAGQDAANTTADGLIHNFRSALTPSATAEVKGDKRSLDSGHPGDAQPWPELGKSLSLGLVSARDGEPVEIKTIENAIISVEYDSESNRSSLTISGTEAA